MLVDSCWSNEEADAKKERVEVAVVELGSQDALLTRLFCSLDGLEGDVECCVLYFLQSLVGGQSLGVGEKAGVFIFFPLWYLIQIL